MNEIEQLEKELHALRPKEPSAPIDGYQVANLFEGNLYWKNRIKEQQHFAIYRKLSSVD